MYLPVGTLLQGGRYEIIRCISSGGFGCTYEARNTKFRDIAKSLAIKEFFVKDFCNRDLTTNCISLAIQSKAKLVENLREKFRAEAATLYSFEHPNIVRVIDTFEENGTAYYVMEYIDGRSLANIVETNGPLSEEEAIGYIRQVADALRYVHSRNYLHLDVKPHNIMVDCNGRTVLMDFGVSKQYVEANGADTSAITCITKGYAPLEQSCSGIKEYFATTDIYSLGATLFYLVTGTNPPAASEVNENGLPNPSGVSSALFHAIQTAMQPRQKDRPQNVDDFLVLLDGKEDRVKIKYTDDGIAVAVNKYVCRVCGYIHEGNKVPDACPLCKAIASKFVPVKGPEGESDVDAEELALESGKTIIGDNKEVELLRKSAEDGNKNAQYKLGLCYHEGKGVTRSMKNAVKWYTKAAEQGHSAAQYKLGICYENGIGVQRSVDHAVIWYRLAAEQGSVKAQRALEKIEPKKVLNEATKARMSNTAKGIIVTVLVIACLIFCISNDFDLRTIRAPLMFCAIAITGILKL